MTDARNRSCCHAEGRDPAGAGTRGVNLAGLARAGNSPMHFPLKRSGVCLEKLAGENIGSLKCSG